MLQRMKSFMWVIPLLLVAVFVFADTTSNVLVGIKQGGGELFVKSGGALKVADTSFFQSRLTIVGINSASNKGFDMAPFAGTVSSVTCTNLATATNDQPVWIIPKINGVAITNASVSFTTGDAAYTDKTGTPTAANTVTATDVLSIESDAASGVQTTNVFCKLFITP